MFTFITKNGRIFLQKNIKSSLLLLTLLLVLVLSISASFAQDIDNSVADLAVDDNDESISIENQDDLSVNDDRCATDSISSANDEEKLDAGETTQAMPQVDTGVVSGGVDYTTVNPWTTSGNVVYTVPDGMTNLKSAIVVVNVYSGSGANTYALYSNVTLNTKNGLEVLGYEELAFDQATANDPNVYVINDHTTKQYSDYQMVYDITGKVDTLTSGDTITINVVDSQYPDKYFDGKIKLISLLFAYDDGDNDNYTYWFHAGQLWTADTANFNFNTRDYAGKTNNIYLRTIALSSSQAKSFKINNVGATPDSTSSGSYYLDIKWDAIAANFNKGSDTNFWFENGGASYKTNVALLVASETGTIEPLTEVYVDYANGNDEYLGTSLNTAFKTISHALEVIEDGGIINVNGVNYLDDAGVNGLTINKNVAIVGLENGATIDARNTGRIFNIGAYTVSLSNLAFVNANAASASDVRGGALYVNGATLTVDNCKFINNTAGTSSYGGAINLKSSTTTVKNSYFENNSAWYTGAGINAENSNVLLNISGSYFINNLIPYNGWSAGVAICAYNTVIIDQSVFYGNRLTDTTRNGKSINQYGTGSLTITNSILLDGEKGVWVASGPTTLENNWWGNNDLIKDTTPKDLGYTNADVDSYLYLNVTMFTNSIEVGSTASVNINLVSTGGDEVNVVNIPATLNAVNGTLDKESVTLIKGAADAVYTITAVGGNSVTVNALGIEETYYLSSGDVVSTEVIYVNSTGGSDSNPGNSWDKAVQTIEKAVSLVDPDGTIYVADGLYELGSSVPTAGISITKNINIIGQSTDAVISGGNTKRIFTIAVGNTLNITKLTLTNGRGSYGGAIQIEDGGNTNPIRQGYLIISDSIISNSYATTAGGAIGTNRASIDNINNVTFIGNSAPTGGALSSAQKGTITIGDNCKFIENRASGRGSVTYAQAKVTTGKNNLFYGNVATGNYGYGAVFGYGFEIGPGNVFVNNRASSGGALYLGGNSYTGSGTYAIFINNTDNNGRTIVKQSASRALTLDNCYWGTNDPNFSALCNGAITYTNYLTLNIHTDITSMRVGESTVITVDLTLNQKGQSVDVNSLPSTLPLEFTVANGYVDPATTELVKGIASATYYPAIMGEGSVTANIYAASETANFNVLPEAGTVFVNSTGGLDTNDGSSWDAPVKTIKHALEIVGEGRTIYLADGDYNLDDVSADGLTIDKNVNIIGMGDSVVIDADNNGRIFNIGACTVTLANLVLINGNSSAASDKRGGALYVNGATLTIDNCVFINNTAGTKAAASGSSTYGGAINLKSSTTTITDSDFEDNTAWSTGGAINAENSNVLLNISDTSFVNNVLLNNGWSAGAAICAYNTVIIDRSIFYGNRLTDTTRNGKSINEYSTGSLTITNSVLLDGEKGVWIASGPTTLENNWWGNNDATEDITPKDLNYTNADVGSYLVLSSFINQDKIYQGDLVTITTTLDGNVIELPIAFDAVLGEITPDMSLMTTGSVSTYNATALGDEVVTIDVLGIKNEIRFTVKETLPDVAITQVKTPWSDGIYPAVNNTFTITVNNAEIGDVEGLVLEVYSNETGELIASYTFDSLASGTSTIALTDPTIRPITEQTVWPAAQNNKIRFTFNLMRGEDLVTTFSVDKILAYNGYLNKTYAYGGHDNVINRYYTINGDIIISTQDISVYMDQYSRSRTETWNIETPEDAEIVKVLLYFNYNWDTSFFPDGWSLTFNEFDILNEYVTFEKDRGNLGGWGAYDYGLLVFDVSEYYKVNEENSFAISKTGNCALYPSTLVVLYNVTDSCTAKDVYFSDICDVYYPNYNQVGYDGMLKHVVYYNGIDLENLVDATWYAFAGSSSSNNDLVFNDGIVVNAFSGYTSNDCRPYAYDVTSLIKNDNEAWFVSSTGASTTVAYEQILVVNRNLNKISSLAPEYTSVPSAYAGTNNAITVTIDVLKPGVFTGRLLADGIVVNETEITLVDGVNNFVVIDPTIRDVDESTVNGAENNKVNYTFQLVLNDNVVSDASIVVPVLYNGNLGKDLAYPAGGMESFLNVTVTGDIVIDIKDVSSYLNAATLARTDVWTVDLDDDSTMVKSFVYVPYNWFNSKLYTEDMSMFDVTFNGASVAPVAWYRDQGNLGNYGMYGYGVLVYDVTGLVANGENTFVLNKRNATPAVYPSVFIYMYNTTGSEFIKEIYISNGADLLAGTTNNVAKRPVHSDSVIDVDSQYASSATLYVFAAGAQAGEGNIVFNDDEYVNVWSGTSSTTDLFTLDITDSVEDSNDISFVATGSTILSLNHIVVITKDMGDLIGTPTLTPEYTSVPSAYAGTNNAITVKFDSLVSGEFIAQLLADGNIVNETDVTLVEGANSLILIDPTIRDVDESTVNGAENNKVNYTYQLIFNDEVVSDASIVVPVLYNGNLGKDLAYPAGGMESFLNVTVTGDIVIDVKDVSSYLNAAALNRTDVWTVSLDDDSTMVKSFVYVPYNWFNSKLYTEDMSMFDVTFNGATVTPVAWYRDQGNLGNYGMYGYGVLVYDVTGLVANGENTFVLNKKYATPAVYPSAFIYMYNTTGSEFIKEIYISNGADLLAGTTNNVAKRPVHSDSVIDVDSQYASDATLYVFAASAQAGEGNIVFNDDEYVNVWSGTSSTTDLFTLDITDCVENSNYISFVATGSTILSLNQIVVLTKYYEDIPILLTPEYTSVPSAYAGTNNAITITIDSFTSGMFTGRLLADGAVVNETEIVLAEGINKFVLIDPTIRDVDESTVNGAENNKVNYTFELLLNDKVISDASIVVPVLYNGYLGKDLAYPASGMESFLNVTVTGDIVVYVNDVSTYLGGNDLTRTDVWTVSLDDDSTMVKSFVYVPYNWFNNKLYTEDMSMFDVTFNGATVTPVAWYRDQGNLGNYGMYGYGVLVYDVTGLVANGENTFVLNKRNATPAVYPSVFIYMYNTTGSEFVKEIYISNGADLIAGTDYNVAERPVHSDSVIDVDSKYVLDADLYVFAASAQAGEGNIVFNGEEYENVWSGTSKTTDVYNLDITDSVEDSNFISFVGTGSTILSLNQIVVLTKFKEIPISLTTEYTTPTAYAGTNNAITVRIDASLSGLFTGRLLADGVVVNETEIILVDSANKLVLIDPTIRDVDESTVNGAENNKVNYTFQLIFNDKVVSDASIVVPVLYNGNLGKDLAYPAGGMESFLNVTISGDIVIDIKDVSSYMTGENKLSRSDVWTINLDDDSNIVKAFVYVAYNWCDPSHVTEGINMFDVTFNGATVSPVAWYRDQSNLGGYGKYGYGVLVYDVTGLIDKSGDNTFTLNKTYKYPAVYPSALVYMYNTTGSDFVKEIYISNGADLLANTNNVAGRPVNADSVIDVDSQYTFDAVLYVFAAGAQSGEGNIVFNGEEYVNVWSGTSQTTDLYALDITDIIDDSNDISFVATGSTILSLNQIIVITKYASEISIENITEPVVGGDMDFVITIPGATGTVKVSVNGKREDVPLTDGVAFFTIPDLNARNYLVYVSYEGNEYVAPCANSTEFTVLKIKPEISIETTPVIIMEDVNVTVSVQGVTDGEVTVIVDGIRQVLPLTDGVAEFTIPEITSGDHSITAVYMGDSNHEFATNTTKFTVDKIFTSIDLEDVVVDYGEFITISFEIGDYATGKVYFTLNENKFFMTLEDGGVDFTLDCPSKGNYTFSAYYEGDENYLDAEGSAQITVNGLDAGLKASVSDIIVGEDAIVEVEIDGAATGAVVAILDDEYPVYVIDGKGSVEISGLASGTYTVIVNFAGDDEFNASMTTASFTVSKKELPNSTTNATMDIPEGTTAPEFSISLPADATGNFTVTVDGQNYTEPLVNGSATVKVPELSVGNHIMSTSYTGDDNYDGFASEAKTVDIPKASIPGGENAINLTSPAGSDSPTYSISLPSDATGNLTVTVDGKANYTKALVNGSASVTVPGLSQGDHNIIVTYSGDDKFSSISKSTTFHSPIAKITNNKDVSVFYSGVASYKVLITKDGKAVGAGESVVITFNGKKTTVKTDSNGYATLKLSTGIKVKTYTITAEYNGEKVTNKVTIKNIIKASNKKVKKSKKVTKVKVSLKKVDGKVLKSKKLTIKFKGKTYKVKTNKKGVATWNVKKSMLKKLKVGKKYKYTVTYGKDVVSKKLTIKR